ncbi:hypothetical protein EYF80_035725 [Liparis tanakae]|uniref:Uncharacterized protein n=1 Tax=Liparis tanakae TaxID=230148 RepID=A0A4Z2GML8_9TELE|nr:hypothetical protein EYF80_035725 [Liparis tanakae]
MRLRTGPNQLGPGRGYGSDRAGGDRRVTDGPRRLLRVPAKRISRGVNAASVRPPHNHIERAVFESTESRAAPERRRTAVSSLAASHDPVALDVLCHSVHRATEQQRDAESSRTRPACREAKGDSGGIISALDLLKLPVCLYVSAPPTQNPTE